MFLLDETSAPGDFDGDGIVDKLFVWKDGTDWLAQIQTDAGFARRMLPTDEWIPARAIGGYDVNGDGIDEAFLVVDAGASSDVVGLYTLHQPDPDPPPLPAGSRRWWGRPPG